MYQTIKRLYAKTGDKSIVTKAVVKGWISEEQYIQITGEPYV